MVEHEPVTELGDFGSAGAVATAWTTTRAELLEAELFWLSTVRPDARPHVTPLIAIWMGGAMYFCTGENERKAKNLELNQHCILTTGRNMLTGLDIVVEGVASKVTDRAELDDAATTYEAKYGAQFTSPEGTWFGLGDQLRAIKVLVFRVEPVKAFAFGKGTTYSQTRYTFA